MDITTPAPPQQHENTGIALMWAVEVQRLDVGCREVFYNLHSLELSENVFYHLHSLQFLNMFSQLRSLKLCEDSSTACTVKDCQKMFATCIGYGCLKMLSTICTVYICL